MSLAEIGSVLADGTRAGMLTVLLDDRARTVTELSRALRVAPSTASEHLSVLREAGLVTVVAQGRHRYHRLAGPEVAQWLEGVMNVPERPEFTPSTPADLRFARTCYDHLAGALGVAVRRRLAARDGSLSEAGAPALRTLGVNPDQAARACLDWSERREHLAGPLASSLLLCLLERHWLVRRSTPRALRLTTSGRHGLTELWGADPVWSS
jgi:DNA-binding transcriptional ArsR family regulator